MNKNVGDMSEEEWQEHLEALALKSAEAQMGAESDAILGIVGGIMLAFISLSPVRLFIGLIGIYLVFRLFQKHRKFFSFWTLLSLIGCCILIGISVYIRLIK